MGVGRQGLPGFRRARHRQERAVKVLRRDLRPCTWHRPLLHRTEQPAQHPERKHSEWLLRCWLAPRALLVGPPRRLVDPKAERQVSAASPQVWGGASNGGSSRDATALQPRWREAGCRLAAGVHALGRVAWLALPQLGTRVRKMGHQGRALM